MKIRHRLVFALLVCASLFLAEGRVAAVLTPTLKPITIDGLFDDWVTVLLNPLQVSLDGNGAVCASNPDLDCGNFTPQRDIESFAWTYFDQDIYTYLTRPTSNSTLTYSFIMDVDADGFASANDFVFKVEWRNGNVNLWSALFRYQPVVAGGSDSLACNDPAGCNNGQRIVPFGYVDGYTMPGSSGACVWPVGCTSNSNTWQIQTGGDGIGTRFEARIPWSALGGQPRPIFWHVASSTNAEFSDAKDNVGGPDGKLGGFGTFVVSLTPDAQMGFTLAGNDVTYAHTVSNVGQFSDRYTLSAVSNIGASLTFLDAMNNVIAVDANGDGDFLDAGDSVSGTACGGFPCTNTLSGGISTTFSIRAAIPLGYNGSSDVMVVEVRSFTRPATVFATAVDTTRIGLVTITPDYALTAMAGATVPFGPFTVSNNTAASDSYDLRIVSSNGSLVELWNATNTSLLARDSNGDGVWDASPAPNASTGTLPGASTATYFIRIVAQGALGSVSTVTFRAQSPAIAEANAASINTLRIRDRITILPSYGAGAELAGAAGSRVFLPHTVINADAITRSVQLRTAPGTLAGGYTLQYYSDPDGDGNPTDGLLLGTSAGPTTSFDVGPFGGTYSFVTLVQLPALGTPASSNTVTQASIDGFASVAASANDFVIVSSVQTFSDSLYTLSARYFPACASVYGQAIVATASSGAYSLRYAPPLGAPFTYPAPSDFSKRSRAEHPLGPSSASGVWTLSVLDSGTPTGASLTFTVEAAGTVVITAPAVTATGALFDVSARLENTGLIVTYPDTIYDVELQTSAGVPTGIGDYGLYAGDAEPGLPLFVDRGFADLSLGFGSYKAVVTWRHACGAVVGSAESAFTIKPPAPVLVSPTNGAVVAGTVTFSGTGEPGAALDLVIDGNVVASTTVLGTGAWQVTLPVADGGHTWTARQTSSSQQSPDAPTRTFIVDTSTPTLIVNLAQGTSFSSTPLAVDGTAAHASGIALVAWSVDGGSFVPAMGTTDWTFDFSPMSPGTYTLTIRATAVAGGIATETRIVTYDNAAPVIVAPPVYSNTGTPDVTGTITDDTAVTATIAFCDANCSSNCSVPAALVLDPIGGFSTPPPAPLASGTHCALVSAVDAAGNNASLGVPVTIDAVAPSIVASDVISNISAPMFPGSITDSSPLTVANIAVCALDCATQCVTQPLMLDMSGNFDAALTSFADGVYCALITAVDAAANAASLERLLTIDTIAPTGTLSFVPAGSGVALSGTALDTAGSGVQSATLTIDSVAGTEILTNIALAGDGSFSVTSSATLGAVTATLSITDIAGNTFDLVVIGPSILVPGAAANGETLLEVSGQAGPLALIDVALVTSDSTVLTTSTSADAGGNYAVFFSGPLVEGAASVRVVASDPSGNSGAADHAFTIDNTPPNPPLIMTPADGSNLSTADTVIVSGTAEPGSTVAVTIGGTTLTTTADPGGAFSVSFGSFSPGDYTATATATDAANNVSAPSSVDFTVLVDGTAPIVVAPPVYANIGTPSVTGTVTDDTSATATIAFCDADCASNCSAAAGLPLGVGGAFSAVPPAPLALGTHCAFISATDTTGNTTTLGVPVTLDDVAPSISASDLVTNINAPLFSGTITDTSPIASAEIAVCALDCASQCVTQPLSLDLNGMFDAALASLADGVYCAVITATDAASNTATLNRQLTIDTIAPTGTLTFVHAGGIVTLSGVALDSGSGIQSVTLTVVSAAGNEVFTNVALDGSGQFNEQSGMIPFTVNGILSLADVAGNTFNLIVVGPSITLPGATANGESMVEVTGYAAPFALIDVSLTPNGGALQAVMTTADASGKYSALFNGPLPEGPATIVVVAADVAGNSGASEHLFTIDNTAPAAPVITSPSAGASMPVGEPIVVSGTAEPGSTVTVTIGGTTLTTTADPSGTFSVGFPGPFDAGDYTVTATATDAAGNVSAPTSVSFVVASGMSGNTGTTGMPGTSGMSATTGETELLPEGTGDGEDDGDTLEERLARLRIVGGGGCRCSNTEPTGVPAELLLACAVFLLLRRRRRGSHH